MLEATWWILPAAPRVALAHGVRRGFAEVTIVTGTGSGVLHGFVDPVWDFAIAFDSATQISSTNAR